MTERIKDILKKETVTIEDIKTIVQFMAKRYDIPEADYKKLEACVDLACIIGRQEALRDFRDGVRLEFDKVFMEINVPTKEV